MNNSSMEELQKEPDNKTNTSSFIPLEDLTEEERKEAIATAEAARRAEERAEERSRRRKQLQIQEQLQQQQQQTNENQSISRIKSGSNEKKVVFLSKRQREEQSRKRRLDEEAVAASEINGSSNITHGKKKASNETLKKAGNDGSNKNEATHLTQSQLTALKHSYLGKKNENTSITQKTKKQQQQSSKMKKKKIIFKFEWDDVEDTSRLDPFYDGLVLNSSSLVPISTSQQNRMGKQQHKIGSKYNSSLMMVPGDTVDNIETVSTKPIAKMTSRDWRIFRENYDIVVRGGKAPPPLRHFHESSDASKVPAIHSIILKAIDQTLQYKEPSPIQRQAIPIGLQRRDLIGVAETGSGKTAAFGVPLCHYIVNLPIDVQESVAEAGPLALVLAPTRELALQIHIEFGKLLTFTDSIRTVAVIGGQSILAQANALREGVHIVVGTPGRVNECIEMTYLVLNQCLYVVLDEADRMIDLGFAPQIEQILDSLGGTLKSEDESVVYQQEMEDLEQLQNSALPRHRLMSMFSATMPNEVERLAKCYLRHPAIVSIGDQDTSKNTRIHQTVIFLSSPAQKEKALRDVLFSSSSRSRTGNNNMRDKMIVFVNEKRQADYVGRMVDKMGKRCVVLHGGKTQEQREENLALFRTSKSNILVATDVAGRGLDIPDITHIINFDVPSRSIDNYCHRIGRTGRAGKEGIAISFITEEDAGIMPALKQYLERTGSAVPDRLARHASVIASNTSNEKIH